MRLIVNQLSTLRRKTGIGYYTHELLRHFRQLYPEWHITAYPEGWHRRLREYVNAPAARPPASASTHDASVPAPMRSLLRQKVKGRLRRGIQEITAALFRRACRRKRCELYLEPNFIPLAYDIPVVVSLHDLSALLYPQWHPPERIDYYERHFAQVLKNGRHFLTLTHYVRRELIEQLQVAPERVTAIYLGTRADMNRLDRGYVAHTLKRLGLPNDYLLYLGTIEPRKNIHMLLQAYVSLPVALRERCPLVLVGEWGWNAEEVAVFLHDEARHHHVIYLGYVEENLLPVLYNGARALVYPSHYEGFGLPPLEMLACGGAVLCSDAGALVEVFGRHAHIIPTADRDGWRQAMFNAISDEDWITGLRRDGASYARSFTWERCARQTARVLESVLHPSQPTTIIPAGSSN
ncbi:MAG: glycosyltransferase family 4 protein [Gemmataceae bacterium]